MLKVVLVDRLEVTEAALVVWAVAVVVAMVVAMVVAVVMGVMVEREPHVIRALETLEPATDTTSARLDSFFLLAGCSVFTVFTDFTDTSSLARSATPRWLDQTSEVLLPVAVVEAMVWTVAVAVVVKGLVLASVSVEVLGRGTTLAPR